MPGTGTRRKPSGDAYRRKSACTASSGVDFSRSGYADPPRERGSASSLALHLDYSSAITDGDREMDSIEFANPQGQYSTGSRIVVRLRSHSVTIHSLSPFAVR